MAKRKVPVMTTDEEAENFLDQDLSDLDFTQFKGRVWETEPHTARVEVALPHSLLQKLQGLAERQRLPLEQVVREALERTVLWSEQHQQAAATSVAGEREHVPGDRRADLHPVDIHIGERMRLRRWIVGMTQQQLGDMIGVSFQTIQKYETGLQRVPASRLHDIASALGVGISYFFAEFSEEEKTEGRAVSADLLADKEALELVRAYYSIPREQRHHLFGAAQNLLKDAS